MIPIVPSFLYELKSKEVQSPVPEIIDPVFTKTSPKRSFCMTENERFGLVFTKKGSINSGTALLRRGSDFMAILGLYLGKWTVYSSWAAASHAKLASMGFFITGISKSRSMDYLLL